MQWAIDAGPNAMTALGLVGDHRRAPARLRVYTIEYTSSESRGIVMHSETHEAASPADALAYAKGKLSDIAAKYGARGYRAKDAEGVLAAITDAAVLSP